MTFTTPAALEILIQQRLADRRDEADQQRLADIASRQLLDNRPGRPIRARSGLALRYLAWLV